MNRYAALLLSLTLAVAFCAQAETAARKPQFVGVLRVALRYQDEKTWTQKEQATVGAHFARLQQAERDGHLILAGRTDEPLDRTFGLVIFEADDLAAAERFMAQDPAVIAGIMTAETHPYAVAIERSKPSH